MGNDVDKANEYLGYFAKLLRATLNNASEKMITIEDEIDYLKQYINLEKLRFQNLFSVKFIIDKKINISSVSIPPMIIQPLIENAIKHGYVHTVKNGLITISFTKLNNDILVCKVLDNGIGYSTSLKSNKNKIHVSKGLQIIKDRVALLNKNVEEKKYFAEINDAPNTQHAVI